MDHFDNIKCVHETPIHISQTTDCHAA